MCRFICCAASGNSPVFDDASSVVAFLGWDLRAVAPRRDDDTRLGSGPRIRWDVNVGREKGGGQSTQSETQDDDRPMCTYQCLSRLANSQTKRTAGITRERCRSGCIEPINATVCVGTSSERGVI